MQTVDMTATRARRPATMIVTATAAGSLLLGACTGGEVEGGSSATSAGSPSTTAPTAAVSSPSASTTPINTAPPSLPPFTSSQRPVSADVLGPTWHDGCPVRPVGLTLINLSYVDFDGAPAQGDLVVAKVIADDVVAAFKDLYEARFPISKMVPIDAYGGDDNASMADDNTSAFNCRVVTGGAGWSQHAYGLAVDINPLENPYVRGDEVLPPAGSAYLDRTNARPGMIVADDVVVRAFAAHGLEWGGNFQTLKDYQHFALPR